MRLHILLLFTLLIPFNLIAGEPELSNPETQTIGEQQPVFITPVGENEIPLLDNLTYQIVTSNNSGSKFFLDQTDLFLIDFHWIDLIPKTIDSVYFNLDGKEVTFRSFAPFFIEGLDKGEHEISIKLIDKSGSEVKFRSNQKGHISFTTIESTPLVTNDAIVLGLLIIILGLIFYTSGVPTLNKFYSIVPPLLLCYFLPAILNTTGIISGEYSNLYYVASRYLLPASLVLLCLSIDLKGIVRLGPKALIMFLTGTFGIVIGGPIALLIIASIAPDWLGADAGEIWRGLATVAGSWIGGGANQTAMKEIFETPNDIFSKMIVVDVIVANVWMAVLLYGAGINKKIDKKFKADSSAIESLKTSMESFVSKIARIPTTADIMIIIAIGLGATALSHSGSYLIVPFFKDMKDTLESMGLSSLTSGFFWLIVFATIIGVFLSFTRLKNYEGAGASKIGSIFLYVLVAAIGTHMDIAAIAESPILFAIGGIWMAIHAIILLLVAKLIKAPFFFVAVGSQANVGGAASAPVVASAFSPSLAPVGVLLAVFGYALGTGAAWLCAVLMQSVNVGG